MTKRSQFAAILLSFSALTAQEVTPEVRFHLPAPPPGEGDRMFIFSDKIAAAPFAAIDFMSTEMTFEAGPIKGLPYSAEATTEFTHTLSDGNRITRKTSSSIHRDAEGRTRRETAHPALGASPEPLSTIIIMDPVAQTTYLLDTKSKTARKLPPFPGHGSGTFAYSNTTEENGKRTSIHIEAHRGPRPVNDHSRKEDLGKQNIEGVIAEGTRTTTTIPAGAIGNERAIQIVHERWYSPELKQVVMSKHTDPQAGETVYRLTRIQRSAPAPSLFEVPPDYRLKSAPEAPEIHKMLRRERAAPSPGASRGIDRARKI